MQLTKYKSLRLEKKRIKIVLSAQIRIAHLKLNSKKQDNHSQSVKMNVSKQYLDTQVEMLKSKRKADKLQQICKAGSIPFWELSKEVKGRVYTIFIGQQKRTGLLNRIEWKQEIHSHYLINFLFHFSLKLERQLFNSMP